ncbi:MAG: inorganic diphosphatase [Blastochloris viridis]|uniref:Inorganic pyrophosphatase n=1 Tax=Blastochloris viridis TaxID=1079 RepID=A0A6N4R957_BLAVI|nr:MAG: inorganic diphosphatase [Blastochloris viridis]
MSLKDLPAGKEPPHDIYVVVENPKHTPHIKYEVDKDTGLLFVDRFAPMPMVFPAHYGFINNTLGGDGDPVDAFVYTDIAVVPGAVVRCRPVGVLMTTDESGEDAKLVCVPHKKLDPRFENIKDYTDLPQMFRDQLEQFYSHYKNLEPGKWVKIAGWGDVKAAEAIVLKGITDAK